MACALTLAVSGAATASDANSPVEYLDEETGVTVTVVGRPLVFARERATFNVSAWSVPARDYVTLAAAAVDRGGKMSYLLIGYFWSVGGASEPWENARRAREPLVLQLKNRRIELVPQGGSAREAGISAPPHRPPIGAALPSLYAIDLPTMELIAGSAQPALNLADASAPLKYQLFEDRLPALRELVRRLSDTP
ncbi:MAG TPA: hypothetical protein VED45_05065 [Steroidobacteraceae bacterium]|nr:hypothetical protein [Steroidobacteraceae bacterium]